MRFSNARVGHTQKAYRSSVTFRFPACSSYWRVIDARPENHPLGVCLVAE
jgi:hypothetical protein